MSTPITPERLAEVLAAHKRWLAGDGGERANLHGANLSGADLHRADLYGANLSGADLHGANLREADLREADLYGANLREADLREADLYGANLYGANLSGTGVFPFHLGPWFGWADPERAVIGCQDHPHAFWQSLTESQANRMHSAAWEQWQAWGPVVLAAIDCASRHGWPKRGAGGGSLA